MRAILCFQPCNFSVSLIVRTVKIDCTLVTACVSNSVISHFIIAEFIELHRSSCCLLITLQRYEYFLNLQYIASIILYVLQNIRYIHILYIAIYSINMFYNIRILLCNILQIKRQYPDGGGCGFRVAGKSQMVTFIPHW